MKAGRLKALAITSLERSTLAPDVPTLAESIPGLQVVAWQGLFAPANTPPAILDRLSNEVQAILKEPALEARLLEMGTYPAGSSREAFAAFVKEETVRWADVVKRRLGLRRFSTWNGMACESRSHPRRTG